MKRALILSGWAMTCAWTAGVYAVFSEHRLFDLQIGISGSAWSLVYEAFSQRESIRRIWTEHLPDTDFINFLRFTRMMDINFLVDTIFSEKEPLIPHSAKSTTQLLIPLTHCKSGELRYFDPLDTMEVYELMRAAKSLPVINGQSNYLWEMYMDSPISAICENHFPKCISFWADEIIVVRSLRQVIFPMLFWWIAPFLYPACKAHLNKPVTYSTVPVFYCTPSKNLNRFIFARNKKDLTFLYDLGIEDWKKFLATFFKKNNKDYK